jgi:hypothetical protein
MILSCSTGAFNKIQISSSTADLIKVAGRGLWVEGAVAIKGKGLLSTYWLMINNNRVGPDVHVTTNNIDAALGNGEEDQKQRLVDWMTELFIHQAAKV